MKRTRCLTALAAMLLALPAWSQVITVTSPVAGAEWCIGSSYTVTWTKTGTMDASVSIRLRLRGAGETGVVTITERTENDGSFGPWTVPAGTTPGEYLVRIRTLDGEVTGSSEYIDVANCSGPAASISNVRLSNTSPHHIGDPRTITWTLSSVTQPLRLQLERTSGALVGVITDSLAAGHTSFNWTAGQHSGGTAEPGEDYRIRVAAADNSVSATSPEFALTNFLVGEVVFPGVMTAARNLELKSVRHVLSRGGYIVARVKNHLNAIDQDVSFRLTFPEGRGPGDQTIVRRVTLAADAEGDVYLLPLAIGAISPAGLLTRVMADGPTSQIDESNEGDNTGEARLTIVDVRVSAPRDDLELSRLYMQGGWDYRMKFKIRVTHNQANPVGNIRVKWEMFDSTGGLIRDAYDTWTIESLASGEEWVRTAEQKFGKHGHRNAKDPELRAGATYRVVASITSPDDFSTNNSDGFSFTVPD